MEAHRGDDARAEDSFEVAAASCREHGMTFHLAATQVEYAEWLAAQGRIEEAHALVAEAQPVLERLRAEPWLARANALAPTLAPSV